MERSLAPRQPGLSEHPSEGVITLFPGHHFEQALQDLEGFDRVWILFWFDRNEGWTPKVLPPRSGNVRRGVFATRSPHRPNAIGLSLCRLLEVKGRTLRVEDPDLLDGTPILDLKPYLPYAEAFPDVAAGWLDAIEDEGEPSFEVTADPGALAQLAWLKSEHGIDLMERVWPLLSRYPYPHPSRRTKLQPDGSYVLDVKSWRIRYAIDGTRVTVRSVSSGYERDAAVSDLPELHDHAAHRAFHAQWPQE